jgi:hypothetical protein
MSLFRGMKIYTVHIPPGAKDPLEKPVFIREGFSWAAFFLTGIWALYHRLWWHALLILIFNGVLMVLAEEHVLSQPGLVIAQIGFQFNVGCHANDWRRRRLAKLGYILSDVTASDNLLRAEQRYFERILNPSH